MTYLDRITPVLDSSDHFQLLDVSPHADGASIQGAFHTMAAGLHPDRHRNSLDPEQHERLVIAYARIAEAYRVLRNSDHREKYLREMAREQAKTGDDKAGEAQNPEFALALLSSKAQRLYRRAVAAKRTGDYASAGLNLRMALSQHPQSGFLMAALKELNKQ